MFLTILQHMALTGSWDSSVISHFGQRAGKLLPRFGVHKLRVDPGWHRVWPSTGLVLEVKSATDGDLLFWIRTENPCAVPGSRGFLKGDIGPDGVRMTFKYEVSERFAIAQDFQTLQAVSITARRPGFDCQNAGLLADAKNRPRWGPIHCREQKRSGSRECPACCYGLSSFAQRETTRQKGISADDTRHAAARSIKAGIGGCGACEPITVVQEQCPELEGFRVRHRFARTC